MKALVIACDYLDLLKVTLPRACATFPEVLVVTSQAEQGAVIDVAQAYGALVYATDAFFARGATFNKWAAVEEALDFMGRDGWVTLLDADVILPQGLQVGIAHGAAHWLLGRYPEDVTVQRRGQLLSPLRRMAPWPLPVIPDEAGWAAFPVHQNRAEHAGYFQAFAADDPHLGPPPWHDVGFRHAGTSDSIFQAKWPAECKIRPPWHVLHLGESGANWTGRATAYADGTLPPEAAARREAMRRIWEGRRGKQGMARFDHERLRD